MHDLAPCYNSKSTRTFLECKGIPRGIDVCESWHSVAPNFLEALYDSMPRRIPDFIKDKRGATKYHAFMMKVYKNVVEFSLESIRYEYTMLFD